MLCVLGAVERATDGWGLSHAVLRPGFLARTTRSPQFLVYTVPFLRSRTVGLLLGVVFKRWGQTGMYVLMLASILVVGGCVGARDLARRVGRRRPLLHRHRLLA